MRRADLVLASLSGLGGALALLLVALTAQWITLGTLLGFVLLANAAVRLRLARAGDRRGRSR